MFKVLILSHGNLSIGMKNTLDLFEIKTDHCTFLNAYVGEENPRNVVRDFLDDEVKKVILTDLKSGSLTRIVIEEEVLEHKNVHLVSGFNLAMLIGLLSQDNINEEIIDEIIAFSKQDIERLQSIEEKEEETFF